MSKMTRVWVIVKQQERVLKFVKNASIENDFCLFSVFTGKDKLSKKRNLEGKNINIINKGKFYEYYVSGYLIFYEL